MIKFVVGFLMGVVVASVGFQGIAAVLDNGVQSIKEKSQDLAR